MAWWHNLNPQQMMGYLHTGQDPDEAAIAPEKRLSLHTSQEVRDTRALLEHERSSR